MATRADLIHDIMLLSFPPGPHPDRAATKRMYKGMKKSRLEVSHRVLVARRREDGALGPVEHLSLRVVDAGKARRNPRSTGYVAAKIRANTAHSEMVSVEEANPKKARRRPALVIRVPVPFPVGQGVLSFMPEAARQARRAAKGPVEGYDREVHDISSSREIWSGPAKEIAVTFVSEENLCPLCGEPMAGEPAKEIAYRGTPGTCEAHAECVDAEMKRWRLKLSP